MSSRRKEKGKRPKVILILVSTIVLAIGYYALNHISNREKPPLGNTFYIIVGCAMIAISSLVILVTLKKILFPKKKRTSKGQVFLKDDSTQNNKRSSS